MQLSEPIIRLGRLLFLISWKATGKKNGCVPLRIDYFELLKWYDCDMSMCLEVLRARATFVRLRENLRFITCHDYIDVFRNAAIVFSEHFFRTVDTSLLLSDWQSVWDPMRTKYFQVISISQ